MRPSINQDRKETRSKRKNEKKIEKIGTWMKKRKRKIPFTITGSKWDQMKEKMRNQRMIHSDALKILTN